MIYFVSPNGDDSLGGTIDAPWKTIENSVNRLTAGDMLYIRGGEYVLAEAVCCHKSGAPGNPIVYAAYGDEKPVNIDALMRCMKEYLLS